MTLSRLLRMVVKITAPWLMYACIYVSLTRNWMCCEEWKKSNKKERIEVRVISTSGCFFFFFFFCDSLSVLGEKAPGLFIRSNGLERSRRDYFYFKMRLMEV